MLKISVHHWDSPVRRACNLLPGLSFVRIKLSTRFIVALLVTFLFVNKAYSDCLLFQGITSIQAGKVRLEI